MHKESWDDLRYLLAVAENGSVSAAARALGVNHATVLRRVAAFEGRHGGEIFDRTPQGYTIPKDRQSVIEAARAVEAAVLSLERVIEGTQTPLQGAVRVTSTDTVCYAVLPPILAELRRKTPQLRIELICANTHLDLARLDADIAVRPAMTLQKGLTGSVASELHFDTYGDPDLPWIGMSGPIAKSKPAAWLEQAVGEQEFVARGDSFLTLREMVAAGIGKAILPTVLGDGDSRFQKAPSGMPKTPVPVWVASHPDMAEVPRIRAVSSLLLDALGRASGSKSS